MRRFADWPQALMRTDSILKIRPATQKFMSPARVPRTLILSDLHLGRPGGAGHADAFETLLSDFDRVIVNGDIAELHHAAYQADAEIELARFRDICVSRGIKLDLIAGNHDPFISDVRSISLADGAVYVTHGDAFHPAVAPWSPFASVMRSAFEASLAAAPKDLAEDAARFLAAREGSIAEWRMMGSGAHVSTAANMALSPRLAMSVLSYWARYPALAADWAAKFAPQASTVIVGHSHRAFVRLVRGRHIVNTGAFGFPGRPHGVVVEGNTVRTHALTKRGHLFTLAAHPKAAWSIALLPQRAAAETRSTRATQPSDDAPASTPAMNRAATPSATSSIDAR
jgi:UDP-2,3-diacylglucosamine pyrophosphatase LpxH